MIETNAGKDAQGSTIDRRASVRFPMEQEVQFKLFSDLGIRRGSGRTINISSKGILFATEFPVVVGQQVELDVQWPACVAGMTPLQLVTVGKAVRCERGQVATLIEGYEFRTYASTQRKQAETVSGSRYEPSASAPRSCDTWSLWPSGHTTAQFKQ